MTSKYPPGILIVPLPEEVWRDILGDITGF